jgi:hypothetical protein
MTTKDVDRTFERDVDVTGDLDVSTVRRPTQAPRRVNVDFPVWMIDLLDQEAARLGLKPNAATHYAHPGGRTGDSG